MQRLRESQWEAMSVQCSRCAKGRLVEIRMRIGENDVVFRRCGRCEAQAWEGAEGQMTLKRVLDLARIPR
jgi:ssDNA-binding Zn-finger/Zn-ribbon topoisomerase 1